MNMHDSPETADNSAASGRRVKLWRWSLRAYLILMPVLGTFCMWGLLNRSGGSAAAGLGYGALRFVFLPLSLIMPPLITFLRPDKDFRPDERPVGKKLLLWLLTAYQIGVIALSYGAAFAHSAHAEAVRREQDGSGDQHEALMYSVPEENDDAEEYTHKNV